MAYDTGLVNRIREYLLAFPDLQIEEKEMFSGLTFMINDKMCVSVSGENLMCRFDPHLQEEVAQRPGFQPMIMKGKSLNGYCYVEPVGFTSPNDFRYWVNLCLDYNKTAESSRKSKPKKRS